MIQFNIYYGTIGKTLGCKYRFTKWFNDEKEAKLFAEDVASSFYYKNEGKYGITPYKQIEEESRITGLDMETLYKDHIRDIMRWYVIPTKLDTVVDLKF